MDESRIAEIARQLVSEAARGKVADAAIAAGLNLRRDLALDSLGLVSLLVRFGEELGADADDLPDLLSEVPINTLADMIALGTRIVARPSA